MDTNKRTIKYMEDNVFLNKNRYKSTLKKFQDLQNGLESKYKSIEMQGSFAIKTAIKPREDNDEYDLDVIINVGNIDQKQIANYFDIREKLQEDINATARACSWGNFSLAKIKKGLVVQFKNELHIDIIPIFEKDNSTEKYLFDFEKKEIEITAPFKLTNLISDNIDINKRITIMIIKKLVQNNYCANADVLPSIGSALINIKDIATNNTFDLKTVTKNLKFIIDNKRGELYNPYVSTEEFYEKYGHKNEGNKYLTALDSLRLTFIKIIQTQDFQLFISMIEEGVLISSPGIEEKTGSGGHA